MLKALPYLIAVTIAIGTLLGAGYAVYQLGYSTRDNELLRQENKAALDAMERIQKTFDEYDKLVAEIETSNDKSDLPPLIRSSIGSLPNPSSKK